MLMHIVLNAQLCPGVWIGVSSSLQTTLSPKPYQENHTYKNKWSRNIYPFSVLDNMSRKPCCIAIPNTSQVCAIPHDPSVRANPAPVDNDRPYNIDRSNIILSVPSLLGCWRQSTELLATAQRWAPARLQLLHKT